MFMELSWPYLLFEVNKHFLINLVKFRVGKIDVVHVDNKHL